MPLPRRSQMWFCPAMRLAFMGTPDFAVPALDALVAAGHDIACVYSQPPRPAGRGKALRPSPVHARAEALGLPVRTPINLRDPADREAFAALGLDAAVVAAYGLILPRPILDAPALGCFNIHASLLPRWRGAAPIHRAILAGDAMTGVTIMRMEAGLDTGPMLATAETRVDAKTTGDLTAELAGLGADLMAQVLADLPAYPPVEQPEDGVTYAAKIDKAETRLDFTQPAEQVLRQIHAFNPPGAFFEVNGERIRILDATVLLRRQEPSSRPPEAGLLPAQEHGVVIDNDLTIACATDALHPTLVQRAGRSPMPPAELLRGFPIPAGTCLA